MLLSFSSLAFSQKFTLEGSVKNVNEETLEAATVFVQDLQDSIPIAYTITDQKGHFSLKVNAGKQKEVRFKIVYIGYKNYNKLLNVPEGRKLDLGAIVLEEEAEQLNEVVVETGAPPVLVKKDTLEYNANSFKTLPNDRVQDLLKKLPGVAIDSEGKITANGVEVEKITVNGMEFFGDKSGGIALNNLGSQVVDKVQLMDYRTDRQKFTGEASTSGTKEINLKLKEGKDKGYFGDLASGYGTDDRYQTDANIFNFKKDRQIGLIGGRNNINQNRGFNALPDASNAGNGNTVSTNLGVNYTKGKPMADRTSANYNFSEQRNAFGQNKFSEIFVPEYYTEASVSNSETEATNHSAQLNLTNVLTGKNPKAANKVQLQNNLIFGHNRSESINTSTSATADSTGARIRDYNNRSSNKTNARNLRYNLAVTPRMFGGKGEFFYAGLNLAYDKSETDGFNEATIDFADAAQDDIVQNQLTDAERSNFSIGTAIGLNKQLFTDFFIIPSYAASINVQDAEHFVYDFDRDSGNYNSGNNFNTNISTQSTYSTTTSTPALRLRYDLNAFQFELEGAYTYTHRKNKDELLALRNFSDEFQYFTYSGSLRYKGKKGQRFVMLRYNQRVNLPTISQLQPIQDVSNITSTTTGNPDLQPAINHGFNLNAQQNLAHKNLSITANGSFAFIERNIVNISVLDEETLIRQNTFANLNGNYSLTGNLGINKSYYSKKHNFGVGLNLKGTFNNNNSIQNETEFTTQTTRLIPSISLNYARDNILDFNAKYNYGFNKTAYDTELFNNNTFFTQDISADLSLYFFKDLFITHKLQYTYNSNIAGGDNFDADALFLNIGLGAQFLEEKITVSLVGYDILKENNGYSRTINDTAIVDTQNDILEQYFMLNVKYTFGSFAGQRNRHIGEGRSGRNRFRGSIRG